MGRTFLFQCPRCHYQAAVVGGADSGFNCFVQTIACRDCSSLYDVTTCLRLAESKTRRLRPLWRRTLASRAGAEDEPKTNIAWYNRLLFSATKNSQWVKVKLRCPVSKTHRIELWNEPGKCPRCRTHLERTLTPYRIWD